MFDFDPSEFLVIAVVAVVAIGPKDLPRALRTAGRWMGTMRRVSGHLREGVQSMIHEAELHEQREQDRARAKAPDSAMAKPEGGANHPADLEAEGPTPNLINEARDGV